MLDPMREQEEETLEEVAVDVTEAMEGEVVDVMEVVVEEEEEEEEEVAVVVVEMEEVVVVEEDVD